MSAVEKALAKVNTDFEKFALGDDLKDKESAMYQSENCCPSLKLAYTQCTDYFHSIDITTRLTTPVLHQVTCEKEFVEYKSCIYSHMQRWVEYRKARINLEEQIKSAQ